MLLIFSIAGVCVYVYVNIIYSIRFFQLFGPNFFTLVLYMWDMSVYMVGRNKNNNNNRKNVGKWNE